LETKEKTLRAGHWYGAEAQKGLAVSLYRADLVPEDLTKSYRKNVGSLDNTEKSALVILVAMDLKQFDMHFAIGTEHPRVGWSERVPEDKIVKTLTGPDGFDTFEPLVGTGKVAPHLRPRVDVTFVGGFKRSHGAF